MKANSDRRKQDRMKIVIVGAGKVGGSIIQNLDAAENDIVLIEQDSDISERMVNQFDIYGLAGNGSSYDTQVAAGVPDADVFIAVTENDEVNLIACIIAGQLGAAYTIARVRNPEYTEHLGDMRRALGISLLINPDKLAADEMARMIQFPTALSIEPFVNNRVYMVEVELPAGHELAGKNLIDFRRLCENVLVCTIVRDGEAMIPHGRTTLEANDRLFVTGSPAALRKVYRLLASNHDRIRSVFIVGGGKLTFYLLGLLPLNNLKVKVIEKNPAVAEQLSEKFPQVHVILGDGSDQDLLEEEGIENYDSVLSLTGVDEENILISLFAIAKEVPRNITKVNRLRLLQVIQNVNLQSVITPHEVMATEIIRVVKALNQDEDSNIESMYRIARGQVEAIQFSIGSGSEACGKSLMELSIRKDVLVTYIVRGRELIVPGGSDTIEAGDRVIVVTKGLDIVDFDDILEK